jgi:predicted alpha/beta hydrolase family esterase
MSNKRQLLFIQGGGKGTHDELDNQLVESLRRELGQGYEVHYPRMPNEEDPSYASWKPAIERMLATLPADAIVVGHSLGATILVKVLAECSAPIQLAAIFLIAAPFVGNGGWSTDDLQFPSDLGTRLPPGVPIQFFHGLEDEIAPPAHVGLYARAVPGARIHRLPGRNHQLNGDLIDVAAAISAV